jgi:hypothetical protein
MTISPSLGKSGYSWRELSWGGPSYNHAMILETSLTLLALFGATLTSATFGFGGALFSMPLLTLIIGLETATPLYALVGWTTALMVTGTSWRAAKLHLVWRLMVATLAGIPLGVLLVKHLPQPWLVGGLGVFLVGFGLYRLLDWPLPTVRRLAWAYPFGLLAGVLGGAYNTNGPPGGGICRNESLAPGDLSGIVAELLSGHWPGHSHQPRGGWVVDGPDPVAIYPGYTGDGRCRLAGRLD